MRITSKFSQLAAVFAATMMLGSIAQAQTGQQGIQFGPRVKLPGQQAQAGQPAAPPPPQTLATFGAWKIQCEEQQQPKAADGSQPPAAKQCGMVQGATSEKNPQAQMTLVVVKTKQGDKTVTMMRVIAPIGVYLPTGVALEIDGNAVGRVPFTRCMPQLCMAFAEASPETLLKLKKGKEANFIIYEAPGIGLPMKLKLDGFDKGLASLDKVSN